MASLSVCLTTMTSAPPIQIFINIDQSYVKLRPLKHRKQVLESLGVLHYNIMLDDFTLSELSAG